MSRETARDMIDKGIVTPHDIDMQVNGANQKASLSIFVSLVLVVQNSPLHDGAKGGVTVHGGDASVTVTSNAVGNPI